MEQIYTPMERVLIDGVTTLEKVNKALELDLMLLKLESELGLMDGLPLVKEVSRDDK